MEAQLHLLAGESDPSAGADWRLDAHTRDLGRRGVREAREALRSALRHRCEGEHDGDDHASAA